MPGPNDMQAVHVLQASQVLEFPMPLAEDCQFVGVALMVVIRRWDVAWCILITRYSVPSPSTPADSAVRRTPRRPCMWASREWQETTENEWGWGIHTFLGITRCGSWRNLPIGSPDDPPAHTTSFFPLLLQSGAARVPVAQPSILIHVSSARINLVACRSYQQQQRPIPNRQAPEPLERLGLSPFKQTNICTLLSIRPGQTSDSKRTQTHRTPLQVGWGWWRGGGMGG